MLFTAAAIRLRQLRILADDVKINPLRYQAPRLAERRFWVVDAIECRAGMEGLRVIRANVAQFPIGGNDCGFAAPDGRQELWHYSTLLNISGLWLHGPFAGALRANHVQMENLNV
jgi:hypothetical protein